MHPRSSPDVAVGAVVLDRSEGAPRVLLIKRARPPMEGRWSLPGGRVERGEGLSLALAREIVEEAGLVVRVGPLIEVVEIIEGPYHYIVLDYVCERAGGELRAGDDAADVAMVPVSEVSSYGVTEAVARVIERALAMTESGAQSTSE